MIIRFIVYILLFFSFASKAAISWPLKTSSDGHYMTDQNGIPFFLHGDAGWEAWTLSTNDIKLYLDTRSLQGFTATILQLESKYYELYAPTNFYGQIPFSTPGDWATANTTYFNTIDFIVNYAKTLGIVVIMQPLYMGFDSNQGWLTEIQASTDAKMNAYGQFLGARYVNQGNIIWAPGGDNTLSDATLRGRVEALKNGITTNDMINPFTAHVFGAEPVTVFSPSTWINLNNTYSYSADMWTNNHIAYQRSPTKPVLMIESGYDNEQNIPTALPVLTQTFQSLFAGASAGAFYGHADVWYFPTNIYDGKVWLAMLTTNSATYQSNVVKLVKSRRWWGLAPDIANTVVTSSKGTGSAYMATTRMTNGETVFVWFPNGSSQTATVDMTKISGLTAKAYFWLPTQGTNLLINTYSTTGTQNFTPTTTAPTVLVLDTSTLDVDVPGGTNASFHYGLIPSNKTNNWTPGSYVGIIGGIPIRTTIYTNLTPSGSDDTAQIQAAANACPSNQVVKLGIGNWIITSVILVPSYITIRGNWTNGPIQFNNSSGQSCFSVGAFNEYQWYAPKSGFPSTPDNSIDGNYTRGISNITIRASGNAIAGRLIRISQNNDTNALSISIHTMGYENVKAQITRIVSISNGTNLIIWPPLLFDLTNSLFPLYAQMGTSARTLAGVEDLYITCSNSTSTAATVLISDAYNCWAKNVKLRSIKNYGFGVFNSVNYQLEQCWVDESSDGPVSNHAGFLVNSSCSGLMHNNVIIHVFPNLEMNFNSSGNVFSYNFTDANYYGNSICVNHGPHNVFNLIEGNISPNIESDGYFGSSSEETIFRNWFHMMTPYATTNAVNGSGIWAVKLNRFNRNATIIGNVMGNIVSNMSFYGIYALGKPNIGNENWGAGLLADQNGFGPPWGVQGHYGGATTFNMSGSTLTSSSPFFGATNAADNQYWTLGWVIQDRTAGDNAAFNISFYTNSTTVAGSVSRTFTSHNVDIFPGPNAWQELDTNTFITATIKGNHYLITATATTPSLRWPTNTVIDSALNGDAMPNSLYLTIAPDFFTNANIAWPPFGLEGGRTNNLNPTNIPAGYAWVNGYWPISGPDTNAPNLNTSTISIDGITWTFSFDEAITFGAGGNSGWTTSMSGGVVTLIYSSGNGTSSLIYTGNRTVFQGETGTVSYTQPGNGIEDNAGNDFASVSGVNVVNNSTQVPISLRYSGPIRRRAR